MDKTETRKQNSSVKISGANEKWKTLKYVGAVHLSSRVNQQKHSS